MTKTWVKHSVLIILSLCIRNLLCAMPDVDATLIRSLTTEQRSLWNLEYIRSIPLDVEIVSDTSRDGCHVQELFFSSEATPDGPNRVFCGVSWPMNQHEPLPVLLELHGGGGHGSAERALAIAKTAPVCVISLDWGGKTTDSGTALRTIWRSPRPGAEKPIGADSPAHRVVIACRRALDYAATRADLDMKKVIIYGGSWGSFYSMLVSGIDSRITDTIALIGAGGWRDGFTICAYGVQLMAPADRSIWLRTYDPAAYARSVSSNVSLVTYANDSYFSYDDCERNFDLLPGPKRLVITPNSDHGIATQPDALAISPIAETLLEYHRKGGRYPEVQECSVVEDQPGLFQWAVNGDDITSSAMYFSPGEVYWRSRYWVKIPGQLKGNLWQAALPAYLASTKGRYFVTVWTKGGVAASSHVFSRGGGDPMQESMPIWPENPLWDQSTGFLAWRPTINHKTIQVLPLGAGGIEIKTSPEDEQFEVITNSCVLLGTHASEYAGLQIALNAGEQAGTLDVELRRDHPRRNKPFAFKHQFEYAKGRQQVRIPWSDFRSEDEQFESQLSFDTLALLGSRYNAKPLCVDAIELFEK